jgi:hypothetical protein
MLLISWLVIPIGIAIHLYYVINYRKNLKKAGENIILIQTKYLSNISAIIPIIIIIILVIISITTKDWSYIYYIILFLFILSFFISIKIYRKINGIYKNGLIYNKYIAWDNVHSYKWINNETISFLLKTGERIDFNKIIEKDKIIEIMLVNNIMDSNDTI